MRPCACDRVRISQPFDRSRDCSDCWMWHHVERFNLAYGGDGVVYAIEIGPAHNPNRPIIDTVMIGTTGPHQPVMPVPPDVHVACVSLGDLLPAQSCGSLARSCLLHNDATVAFGLPCPQARRQCAKCHDHLPANRPELPPIGKRHLAYHLLPVKGLWKRHVDELRRRWDLFDGTKTIAVMCQAGSATRTHGGEEGKAFELDNPRAVKDYLPSGRCEVVLLPNSTELREVQSWVPLWTRAVGKADPEDAIFYGHSKGVTRQHPPGSPVELWTDALHKLHLDHWPRVERSLRRYPITGAFLKSGQAFPDSQSSWHYSGSFFWVRADDMADRPWRNIEQTWCGNEAWPGIAYPERDAGCFFHRASIHANLYDHATWEAILLEYERWKT